MRRSVTTSMSKSVSGNVKSSMRSNVSVGGTASVNQDVEGLRLREEQRILMSRTGPFLMLT